jgi:hypothetical protein
MAKKKRRLGALVDGTTYKDETPLQVITILEHSRNARQRVCVRYGDTQTGRDWGDMRMCGHVGRSTGSIKIPLLIKTRRSMGGEGILDAHIVQITEPTTKRVLYTHPKYHGR